MKKLTVLSLVMAMASLATASLVYTPDLSTDQASPVTLSAVLGEASVNYAVEITVTGDLVIDVSGASFPGAGSFWVFGNGITGTATDTWVRLTGGAYMANAAGTACFDGVVITGTCGTVTLREDNGTVISPYIPEPMTIGLVGVGMLFLRHRK